VRVSTPCHLSRLVHLDEVASTWHQEQLQSWKEFVETPSDAFVHVGIRVAKMIRTGLNSLSFEISLVRDVLVQEARTRTTDKCG
jgi:hypothetical protein